MEVPLLGATIPVMIETWVVLPVFTAGVVVGFLALWAAIAYKTRDK